MDHFVSYSHDYMARLRLISIKNLVFEQIISMFPKQFAIISMVQVANFQLNATNLL